MKIYIVAGLIASAFSALQASQFEEVRQESLLKHLPGELIGELRGFAASQIFQAIASAKNYQEAIEKVRQIAANPIHDKDLKNPQFMDKLLLVLSQKRSQESASHNRTTSY